MESTALESWEYYEYRPAITERMNEWGADFPIEAYNEDIITQPSKSYLIFRGKLALKLAADGNAVANLTDVAWFVCNGIMHAFDRIEYQLGRTKVDDILKPGITMLMKGLPSFSRIDKLNDAGWVLARADDPTFDPASGQFHICVPLSLMFGIHDDHKGYIYRTPQRLVFTKNASAQGLDCIQAADLIYTMTITFDDIVWCMPQIKFNPVYDAKIKAQILHGVDYQINFRHWQYNYTHIPQGTLEHTWDFPTAHSRAKYVLIAFQQGRAGMWTRNLSEFDFVDIRSVQVQLNNSTYYPKERPSWNSTTLKYTSLYQMFKDFQNSYYSVEDGQPIITMKQFKDKYPIICIDCSRKPDIIKDAMINIKIRFEWGTQLAARTTIHCVIISDAKVKYNPLHSTVIA